VIVPPAACAAGGRPPGVRFFSRKKKFYFLGTPRLTLFCKKKHIQDSSFTKEMHLLHIFNFHWSFILSFFLSLLTLIYSGARGGKRIQRSLSLISMLFQLTPTIYDHTSQFLLFNTFLSIAYFGWGGVINPVLCLAMPGLIYIPPSDMVMFVTS
jgi:hypothetical protein